MKPHSSSSTQQKQVTLVQQQAYSGPVPRPEDLHKYEQVQPGFADRLIRMAEIEQESRIATSQKLVDLEIEGQAKSYRETARGQWFGLIATTLVISLCAFAFYLGYPVQACTIASVVIASTAAIFVTGRLSSKKLTEK